jgi:hypothetical protein
VSALLGLAQEAESVPQSGHRLDPELSLFLN